MAADRRELAALTPAVQEAAPCSALRWSRLVTSKGRPFLLAANGPGRRNARAAVQLACESFTVGAVVSTGYAGALDPSLRVGGIIIVNRIIQFDPRLEYAVRLPTLARRSEASVGALLTMDQVVQTARRKAELRAIGAAAVDMEASAVAAEAEKRKLPFYCVRAISDEAQTSFAIDLNRARRTDGTFSGWHILGQAALRPRSWKQLPVWYRDAATASQALGAFFRNCRFEF